jgi:hypothetical protein
MRNQGSAEALAKIFLLLLRENKVFTMMFTRLLFSAGRPLLVLVAMGYLRISQRRYN